MTTRTPSPKTLLAALLTLLCALAQAAAQESAPAPDAPKVKIRSHRRIEPNTLAPELYEDRLSMKFTLVDLPGATDPRSTWDASYQLYFISEAEFRQVSEAVVRRQQEKEPGKKMFGWDPSPADFPGKILLAEGTISKKNVASFGTAGFGVKAAAVAFGARQFEDALGALERIAAPEARGVALVTLCRAVLQRPKNPPAKTL